MPPDRVVVRETDKRAFVSCPLCRQELRKSCDMWGPFWVCERCGFAAEDDYQVRLTPPRDEPPCARSDAA